MGIGKWAAITAGGLGATGVWVADKERPDSAVDSAVLVHKARDGSLHGETVEMLNHYITTYYTEATNRHVFNELVGLVESKAYAKAATFFTDHYVNKEGARNPEVSRERALENPDDFLVTRFRHCQNRILENLGVLEHETDKTPVIPVPGR